MKEYLVAAVNNINIETGAITIKAENPTQAIERWKRIQTERGYEIERFGFIAFRALDLATMEDHEVRREG